MGEGEGKELAACWEFSLPEYSSAQLFSSVGLMSSMESVHSLDPIQGWQVKLVHECNLMCLDAGTCWPNPCTWIQSSAGWIPHASTWLLALRASHGSLSFGSRE